MDALVSPKSEIRYRTVVVDPPWDHSDGTGMTLTVGMSTRRHPNAGTRTVPYGVMTLAEIAALPVSDIAAPDAHLYLWTTNRFLRQSWDIAEAWGFSGVCVITWCKAYRGVLGGGAWQANAEFCLFARRGSLTHGPYAELFARRARFGWDYPIGDQALGGVAA